MRIWDLRAGELLFTLQSHTGAINSAAFSRDGQFFASGWCLTGLFVFDWARSIFLTGPYKFSHTNQLIQLSPSHVGLSPYTNPYTNMCFSAGGADQMVMVWQANLVGVADPHQTPR